MSGVGRYQPLGTKRTMSMQSPASPAGVNEGAHRVVLLETENRSPEDEACASGALSDLVRRIAMVAAPHGYVATARLLGGVRGNRLLLHARLSEHEYLQEVSLETLERDGAAAVGNAFDRAACAAFTAAANC